MSDDSSEDQHFWNSLHFPRNSRSTLARRRVSFREQHFRGSAVPINISFVETPKKQKNKVQAPLSTVSLRFSFAGSSHSCILAS